MFVKGQSGNPNGVPKHQVEAQRLMKVGIAKMGERALTVLDRMLDADEAQLQFNASKLIIEYTLGKPKQETDVNLSGNVEVKDLTDVERATRLGGILARLEARLNEPASESE